MTSSFEPPTKADYESAALAKRGHHASLTPTPTPPHSSSSLLLAPSSTGTGMRQWKQTRRRISHGMVDSALSSRLASLPATTTLPRTLAASLSEDVNTLVERGAPGILGAGRDDQEARSQQRQRPRHVAHVPMQRHVSASRLSADRHLRAKRGLSYLQHSIMASSSSLFSGDAHDPVDADRGSGVVAADEEDHASADEVAHRMGLAEGGGNDDEDALLGTVMCESTVANSVFYKKAQPAQRKSGGNFVRLNLRKKGHRIGAKGKYSTRQKRLMNRRRKQGHNTCYACGEKGHYASECPLARKQDDDGEPTTLRSQRGQESRPTGKERLNSDSTNSNSRRSRKIDSASTSHDDDDDDDSDDEDIEYDFDEIMAGLEPGMESKESADAKMTVGAPSTDPARLEAAAVAPKNAPHSSLTLRSRKVPTSRARPSCSRGRASTSAASTRDMQSDVFAFVPTQDKPKAPRKSNRGKRKSSRDDNNNNDDDDKDDSVNRLGVGDDGPVSSLSRDQATLHPQKSAKVTMNTPTSPADCRRDADDEHNNEATASDRHVLDAAVSDEAQAYWTSIIRQFGLRSFRDGQLRAITTFVKRGNLFVTMPTGSGKSLIFQVLARHFSMTCADSIALVVFPLVALIENQIKSCVPKALWLKSMNHADAIKALKTNRDIEILFTSPEIACDPRFSKLMTSEGMPKVSFACVDEAHCVSEWSHHFRPSFSRLSSTFSRINVKRVLALTATATASTRNSVCRLLGMPLQRETATFCLPSHLTINVLKCRGNDEKFANLLPLLRGANVDNLRRRQVQGGRSKQQAKLKKGGKKNEAMTVSVDEQGVSAGNSRDYKIDKQLVFCTTRRQADEAAAYCRSKLHNANIDSYHAGLAPNVRLQRQKLFYCGKIQVLFVTVAFGMGIDIPDINLIVHFCVPKSPESFVQEMGRARTDAHCVLLYDAADVHLLENLQLPQLFEIKDLRSFLTDVVKRDGKPHEDAAEMFGFSKETIETIFTIWSRADPGNARIMHSMLLKLAPSYVLSEEKISAIAKKLYASVGLNLMRIRRMQEMAQAGLNGNTPSLLAKLAAYFEAEELPIDEAQCATKAVLFETFGASLTPGAEKSARTAIKAFLKRERCETSHLQSLHIAMLCRGVRARNCKFSYRNTLWARFPKANFFALWQLAQEEVIKHVTARLRG